MMLPKGFKFSLESRRKMSESAKKRYQDPEERRKTGLAMKKAFRNSVVRKKMSGSRKGWTFSPEDRQKISEALRGKTKSKEHRQKISETLKGRTLAPEHREKVIKALKRQIPTSIELMLQNELRSRGLDFETEYCVMGYFLDIAFPNLKIGLEADGEYWHNLPGRKEHASIRDRFLEDLGWVIYRFPGNDIKSDAGQCVDSIEQFLRPSC